jgi:hypothetical protein
MILSRHDSVILGLASIAWRSRTNFEFSNFITRRFAYMR